jgi:hypothetical protein
MKNFVALIVIPAKPLREGWTLIITRFRVFGFFLSASLLPLVLPLQIAVAGGQLAFLKSDLGPEALSLLTKGGMSPIFLNAILLSSRDDSQADYLSETQRGCEPLKRVLDAMGGPKLTSVRVVRIKATGVIQTSASQKIAVQMEEVSMYPDKIYRRIQLPTNVIVEVITPENNYVSSGDKISAVPTADVLQERVAWRSSPIYIAQHFDKYSCARQGSEQIGNVPTTKLRIKGEGIEFYWYIDPSVNRIVRVRSQATYGEMVSDVSDWRAIDGIYVPFRSHRVANSLTLDRTITEYQVNPTINAELFELPKQATIESQPPSGRSTIASPVSTNQRDTNPVAGFLLGAVPPTAKGATINPSVPTNTDFSFKGNTLGMTLEQFRSNPTNVASIWINTGNPAKRLDKKKSQQVNTPLCSDQYAEIEDFPAAASGEIICLTGTPGPYIAGNKFSTTKQGGVNAQSIIVAGHDPEHVWYRFYGGHLYAIEIGKFAPLDFGDLLQAFEQKFGKPNQTTKEDYQNGFGAHWSGEVLIWQKGPQVISLKEGPGNGPGQDHFSRIDGPEITFLDLSIAEQLRPTAGVKPDF